MRLPAQRHLFACLADRYMHRRNFHIQQFFLYLLPFPISASCCIPGALAVVRCQFEYLLFFFLDLLANLLYCRRRALKMSLLRQRLAASSHNLSCAVSTLARLLPRCPDRTSVVQGHSVSVRVDIGGRR